MCLLDPSRGSSCTPAVAQEHKLKCDIRASFAIAFKNWRRKNNVPLKQIAADLGLSVNTINLWELGKRFPTGQHFEMLAEYTGVPPCRLFCVMADKCVPAECLLVMPKKPKPAPTPRSRFQLKVENNPLSLRGAPPYI